MTRQYSTTQCRTTLTCTSSNLQYDTVRYCHNHFMRSQYFFFLLWKGAEKGRVADTTFRYLTTCFVFILWRNQSKRYQDTLPILGALSRNIRAKKPDFDGSNKERNLQFNQKLGLDNLE